MVFSSNPGLLPTPNSPQVHSLNMNDFIQRSCYPIPYQAVTIIENFAINGPSTWDLNVAAKHIKFKAEWNLSDNSKADRVDMFPKPILNSLRTYNLDQPTWNTSYTSNKLSIKFEWKISQSLDNNTDQSFNNISPNSPNPHLKHPTNTPSSFSTPANSSFSRYNTDSGYKSSNASFYGQTPDSYRMPRNVNKPNTQAKTPFSPINLFQSPRKSFSKQDIYRPKSNKSANISNAADKPTISEKSNEIDKNINNTQNNVRGHASDNIQASLSVDTALNQSNSVSELSCEHKSTVEFQSTNTGACRSTTSTSDTNTRTKVSLVDSSDLYSDSDYEPYDDFDPRNNSFAKPPKSLSFDENGYLRDDIDAEYMNLSGTCRLCGDQIPSYLTDLHVIECADSELDPVHEFTDQYTDKLYSECDIIINIMKDILSFEYNDSKVPNDTFKTKEQFYNFGSALDELCKSQANSFFDQCSLPKSRTVNILKYN